MNSVRTRFAPSPTGFLHIGGARTALFCWLYARHTDGAFVLRVEDTDRERFQQQAVDAILEGLRWLGIKPDEGPFFQSDNTEQHRQAADKLLRNGQAYRCFCTSERLDAMRAEQRAQHKKPRYDGCCRSLPSGLAMDADQQQPSVVRFKAPPEGETSWKDQIQGVVRFQNHELDDLILLRSDGSPTYNLAVVVDDHAMEITHVIRGDDHINNTPRQIQLFKALGWTPPIYAHMPLLHGEDGAKLSKRHGAVSVLHYRDAGYLPEAVNNYLVRLGWSHGEQEIFSREEMIRFFEIEKVGRSSSIFSPSKLDWLNGHHMRQASPEQLIPGLVDMFQSIGIEIRPEKRSLLKAIIPGMQERTKTLREMAEMGRFYFTDEIEPYQPKAVKKHMKAAVVEPFGELIGFLERVSKSDWTPLSIETLFKKICEQQGIGLGKLAQPVRIALTGTAISPGIYDVLSLLGKEESLKRLHRGNRFLRTLHAS